MRKIIKSRKHGAPIFSASIEGDSIARAYLWMRAPSESCTKQLFDRNGNAVTVTGQTFNRIVQREYRSRFATN